MRITFNTILAAFVIALLASFLALWLIGSLGAPLWVLYILPPLGFASPFILAFIKNYRRVAYIKSKTDWDAKIRAAAIRHRVIIGMNEEQVILSWGRPTAVDEQRTNGERWRYGYGYTRRTSNFVYFTNGLVSQIKT